MHDDEYEAQQSTEEDFRTGVAQASMDVMDSITAHSSECIVSFYSEAERLVRSMVEGGLTLDHAAQVMVSYAAGAAIHLVTNE